MGYTRIVQFGDITEIYEYENNKRNTRKKHVSLLTRRRNKKAREIAKSKGVYLRAKRNILRTTRNFFRLCHHNNCRASTICFLTLTFAYDLSYKASTRYLAKFMERMEKTFPEVPLSYISVPELTKKGRYHFHILLYNLPTEEATKERETRNLQRLFERGYVDLRIATYTSKGIAGYMAKYMAKALTDPKNETTRGYNCSRNIDKTLSYGGNTLDTYKTLIIPTDIVEKKVVSEYDVPYLGKCLVTRITKK